MKKQTKAVRIRRLIILEGASDAAIAKTVKCHVSYVWQVRKKLEKDIDTDTRVNMDAHSSGVQFDTPRKVTRVPTRTGKGTGWADAPKKEADALDHWENAVATPKSILDEAKDIIYGDREKTYGAPDKNLKAIAGYWANHLHTRFGVYHDVTPEDVCIMMVLLKAARLGNDITHRDSQVDAVGYLALMERIQK